MLYNTAMLPLMIRKALPALFLLFVTTAIKAAELPPLADRVPAWAASLGQGAVATAEKRDGKWSFAMAGQPFAAGHAAVPAEQVIFEIGSISKVASCWPTPSSTASSASTTPWPGISRSSSIFLLPAP